MAPIDGQDTQGEGLDFVCTICEGGNGGQVCETCHDRIPAFKRWLVATETMPKAHTRCIIVRKSKRHTLEALPYSTIFYSASKEEAESHLEEMGKDAERYEIREIKVTLL